MLLAAALALNLHASSCALGAYRSPRGDLIAITQPLPNSTVPRYTLLSGLRGNTDAVNSPARCENGVFVGRTASGTSFNWTHLAFRATPATFESHGAKLNGLLLEPKSVAKPPLVVFVHGSEKQSPIGLYYQELLTAQGVSTFFYDKRGTGKSGGIYTQDFMLLADDAANAANAARKLAAGRFSRIGFFGGSQGGWVAPLAALKSHADFLEVGFGVVGTALEQDQWQVDYQLREDGFGSDVLPAVHRVTDATANAVETDFTNLDRLREVEKTYAGATWYSKIDGQYSGDILKGKIASVKHDSDTLRIPWQYTGLETLRQLDIPQLWVFAKDDSIAPSATSIKRLQALSAGGARRSVVVFPNTDHGIRTFTVDAHGQRSYDGSVANGYLRLLGDFAKGTLSGTYGDAVWVTKRN